MFPVWETTCSAGSRSAAPHLPASLNLGVLLRGWPLCVDFLFTLPYLCNFLLCQRLTIEEKFYFVCSLLVLTQKCLHHSQMFFFFLFSSRLNWVPWFRDFPVWVSSLLWYQANSNWDEPGVMAIFGVRQMVVHCVLVILCQPCKFSCLSGVEGCLTSYKFLEECFKTPDHLI